VGDFLVGDVVGDFLVGDFLVGDLVGELYFISSILPVFLS